MKSAHKNFFKPQKLDVWEVDRLLPSLSPYTVLISSQHFANIDKMILTSVSTHVHTSCSAIDRVILHFSQKHSKLFAEIVPQAENWIDIPLCPPQYPGCYATSRTQLLVFCKSRYFVVLQHSYNFMEGLLCCDCCCCYASCSRQLLHIQSQNCQDIALISAWHLFLLAQLYFDLLMILLMCLLLAVCHMQDSW